MSWLPLPYIQLESARTNGTDYLDTQWSAGYGFGPAFAGAIFTNGGYLFGAMTSEDSDDKFALQFQDGKYILYYRNKTAESPADYELGEPHYFYFYSGGGESCTWNIDGVSMPTLNFDSGLMQNPMSLPVYVGAVNVGGEAQYLSDVQIGYISFNGSSGLKEWRQCKTQDGKFGFYLYSGAAPTFVEKPDFAYGGVMALQSGTVLTVAGTPTKKEYKLGEPFDITGATVYLNLDDGTQRDVTDEASPNSSSYAYFQNNKILQHGYISYLYYHYNPVGVEYSSFQFGGREYSVTLPQTLYYTVSSDSPVESIEVTKPPDKTEYLIKDYFNTSGMIVTGHLANGETAEIGDSTGWSGISAPFKEAGTFDVVISWYDGSKAHYAEPFQITVKNAVEKLNITLPTKSEYSIGEKFNPTGITVTALYLDGTERPIYNFFVDSSKFDSAKEGGYPITVKATVDEKEYTETITVYVFGAPKKLEDLLGTTEGMTVIRNNSKNDGGKDTISGVDWFVFDGNTASKIYVSGDNFISFNNTTEHIKICRRDGATYYVYSQSGKLDDGRKFFKIRVEGYTYWSSTDVQYALKYELFLFDDNSMFLNILQAPTNTSYLGTSELLYGTTHVPFTVKLGEAQEFRFFTSDPAQGKPWTVIAGKPKKLEELLDTTEGMTAIFEDQQRSSASVDGAPWFNFDGNAVEKIVIVNCSKIRLKGTGSNDIYVCGINDGNAFYLYRQEGVLDNGYLFLKICVDGYLRYKGKEDGYEVKYEFFLFSDGGMFLNVIQLPTNQHSIGQCGVVWSDGKIPFSFTAGNPQKVSLYTDNPAQGKPWTISYYDYDFEKTSVRYLTAVPTKREYEIGEEFDANAFEVTATRLDGRTENVADFIAESARFRSDREGRYTIAISAEIDGKKYTTETLVVVYGEPYSIYDLVSTISGMGVQSQTLYHYGITHAHIYGVPWFNFDGKNADNIEIAYNGRLYFADGENENLSVCGNGQNIEEKCWIQEGRLGDGHRFFKFRAVKSNDDESEYELFLFDDNSMFLNIIETASYSGDRLKSFLQWSDGKIDIPVEKDVPMVASFYTTDASLGKPWTVEYDYNRLFKKVTSISAIATKREYNIGEYLDQKAIKVTANYDDGTEGNIRKYTVESTTYNRNAEGRYTVTVKVSILDTEYTADAIVVVYGGTHDILDLLNTTDGMENIPAISAAYNNFGDVSWFVFDEKPVFEFSLLSRNHIYINGKSALDVCANPSGTSNDAYIQEGRLSNEHKFFKLRAEALIPRMFPCYELFLFDDNSIYLNLISTQTEESNLGESKLIWSDGKIEMPVEFEQPQKFSFYTENPSEGKPWTMEADYHDFIKERFHSLTVVNGSGSGDYLEGQTVTVTAEEREYENFLGWTASVEGLFGKARVKNYNKSGAVHGATIGNTLFYYYHSASEEPPVYDGWDYIGSLDGKGSDGQSSYYAHIYTKTVESENDSSMKLPCYEIEGAKEIVLQEYTKQESVIMYSDVKLTCAKRTNDLYLWYVFSAQFWTGERWTITPDVARIIPEDGAYNIVVEDGNIPAVQFTIQQTRATNTPASMAGFLVNTYSDKDKSLKFVMPAENVTVTANYSPKLGRIEITEKPFRLNYSLNEKFDRSGMVVTLYYADGTSTVVRDYTVSDLDSSTVGAKELTVSYTDGIDTATATLTVNVGISGIMITKYPQKTAYKLYDDFDPTGLEVSIVYDDNSTTPTEDYTLSGYDKYFVGIKNITATYKIDGSAYAAQFSVTVTKNGDNPFSGYNENRTLRIHFISGNFSDITGDEIEGESLSMTESLGNDKNLRFGGCVSTQFSVNIFSEQFLDPDVFPEGDIEAYLETPEDSLKIFTGTIDSAERTGGINKRRISAYDYLKRKGTIKLKNWYNSLTFPMYQKDFRDSLFEYVGIEQVPAELVYDYARVPDNMNVDSLTFLSLVKDICLCNSCFGHMNADGKFEYIRLSKNGRKTDTGYKYYTPEDLISDDNVINATFKEGKIWHPKWYWITPNPYYPKGEPQEPSDQDAYEGNIYFIRNSYMIGDSDWINKSYLTRTINVDEETIVEEYLLKYVTVTGPRNVEDEKSRLYLAREYSLTTPGNFLRRIGTNIAFNCIKYLEDGTPVTWTINSYIMSRTITGIRSLKDVYTAKNSAYNEEAYGAAKDLRDVTDAVTAIKDVMPKSTTVDEQDPEIETIEPFGGVKTPKVKDDKEKEDAKKKENPNTLYVYPDGEARYNGTTISGSGGGGGGGGFNVVSVESLPENPDLNNTIYLIQGEVVVE